MKQLFQLLFVAFFATTAFSQSKAVNAAASKVNWTGYKVTGKHEGTINVKSGNLTFNGEALTGGSFVIDMNSINVTDLTDKGKAGLEGHLKADDFFGVATHPEAKFAITRAVSKGKAGEYKIIGNLTIKGITKEIKFDATVAGGMAKASIKVDRADFGVKYGSGSFMDNLGDKTIYDEFDLMINLAY